MKRHTKVRDLVVCGLFAAIIAAFTLITIPLPNGVPLTLQTLAVMLCGYTLGAVRGTVSTTVYIALGAMGLPIFSGFGAGFAVLAGGTGGFIWGFIPMALLCGLTTDRRFVCKISIGLTGLLVCHLLGALQFAAVTHCEFTKAFALACLPYLPKDIILTVVAAAMSPKLKRAVK